MFVLVEMKDTIIIQPKHFGVDIKEAIENDLNSRLANKVVFQVGLCIALWDISRIEESYIFPGDGAYHTVVYFRFVVFRPFIDEVLIGTIKNCSPEGVQVSMSFFDDVLIPPANLPTPSKFSYDNGAPVWIWNYETDGEVHELAMEKGDTIRFRTIEEIWKDTTPPTNQPPDNQPDTRPQEEKATPFTIIGSASSPGLGLVVWWNNTE